MLKPIKASDILKEMMADFDSHIPLSPISVVIRAGFEAGVKLVLQGACGEKEVEQSLEELSIKFKDYF